MSDLRPSGISVMIGGEEHKLLFSLGAIDSIQSRYNQTVSQTLIQLLDEVKGPGYLRFVLTELLNDEAIRSGDKRRYTEEEVGAMVLQKEIPAIKEAIIIVYSDSVPEADVDEDGGEKKILDIAQLLILATTKMGYSEKEVFDMTPRKFFLLLDRLIDPDGKKKEEKKIAPIDLF